MNTSDQLDLKPLDLKQYKKHKGYSGFSVNRKGYLLISKMAEKDLGISNGDHLVLSKHGKRWFVTTGKEGLKLTKPSNKSNYKIYVGAYLIKVLCDDLQIEKKHILLSKDRIPSGGLMWYELKKQV